MNEDLENKQEGRRKPDKLAAALANGHLWRAKEILAGRIASGPFSPDTYEQYGILLLRMGDDLQAGRFLFLCGRRLPEYQGAIDLFVRRYSRAGWQSLVAALPPAARRCAWSDLPSMVRDELIAAGVPSRPEGEALRTTLAKYPVGARGWDGCLVVLLVAIGAGLLLAVVVAYFYEA